MNTAYDKDTRTLTIVLTPEEHSMFAKVRQSLGLRAVQAQLETWIVSQTSRLAVKDVELIKSRIANASASEIDAIKSALNIT